MSVSGWERGGAGEGEGNGAGEQEEEVGGVRAELGVVVEKSDVWGLGALGERFGQGVAFLALGRNSQGPEIPRVIGSHPTLRVILTGSEAEVSPVCCVHWEYCT